MSPAIVLEVETMRELMLMSPHIIISTVTVNHVKNCFHHIYELLTFSRWVTPRINLGPLLFLIYINDLPNLALTGTKILLYADDTSRIVTSSNLENFETELITYLGKLIIGLK